MYKKDSSEQFTGRISITKLNGNFIIGYTVEKGKLKSIFKLKNKSTLKSKSSNDDNCVHFTATTYGSNCIRLDEVVITAEAKSTILYLDPFVNEGNGDYEYDYTLDWNFGDGNPNGGGGFNSNCTGGKVLNPVTSVCECPTGYTEDSNGKCVVKCETTEDDLKKVFPNTNSTKLKEIADIINKYGKDFGIDNNEKLQHFISQAGHESDDFNAFEEYTNYNINRLHLIFSKHFNPYNNPTENLNKQNPLDYQTTGSIYANSEKLYNYVYNDANRGKKHKLGNIYTGDGYKFRGRGIFQLTGRANYQNFNTFYQNKYDANTNLINTPELLSTNNVIAVISALWFFKNKVNIDIDENTTVEEVTDKINGGDNGVNDRKQKFNKAKTNINCIK
ncbi:glycoside hydrolase family 19 protein [Polaribacter uvawellassae]|uniref:glycoside hydrolase family 19 protein n=1 Tax=Polaribacter uvawellassae TaxID=3133495 RepID=UPI003219086B